jgi:hypothetical protein
MQYFVPKRHIQHLVEQWKLALWAAPPFTHNIKIGKPQCCLTLHNFGYHTKTAANIWNLYLRYFVYWHLRAILATDISLTIGPIHSLG